MEKFENIQLIIFDLDGTLVDSSRDICDATNVVLSHFDKPPLAYDDIPFYLGGGLTALLRKALGRAEETDLAVARRLFDAAYDGNYTNKTRPYPGVVDTLEQLADRKKAVFSNKHHNFTVGMIRNLGLDQYFNYVLGAQPEVFTMKPSPAGIYLIMETLDVSPKATLIVGDSTHDIEAGLAAGIYTCAVTYGYRSREVLQALHPDRMIDRMEGLLDLI